MSELERANALHAAGRLVPGLTRLSTELVSCDRCQAEGRSIPALVTGRTHTGRQGVAMCAEHFDAEGEGLGPEAGKVLIPAGPVAAVEVPPASEPAGYAKAILDYGLTVLPPHRLTFIAAKGAKHTIEREGRTVVVLPATYRPDPGLAQQLAFALKYDGVNLEVLSALFRRIEIEPFERELTTLVATLPTGQYVRRLWYLYELLSGRRLPCADLKVGNYVPLLDPDSYYTSAGRRSPRQRINDNLLGTPDFSPIVRRTRELEEREAEHLGVEAAKIVAEFDEDAVRRAVSYLYTKETRSSFGIEGERPTSSRAERFVALLKSVPALAQLSHEQLARLQAATVDPRFAEGDYRSDQVYVAEPVDLAQQRIHFIGPRPEDVRPMMQGLLDCARRLEGSALDPVIQAAVLAFGFVFIHPFSDGNGRLHRLLVHYVLARSGFTPSGLIFPVSAVMLQRRHEYDEVLESFSVPLMRLIDYDEDPDGAVTVKNETAQLYRYFDATVMAEALYRWVEQTVREEFRRELEFVVGFRRIRQQLGSIVELPDKQANLFIKLCLQNNGQLSPAKRKAHFSLLTDGEVSAMEAAVQAELPLFRRPAESEAGGSESLRRTGPRRQGS